MRSKRIETFVDRFPWVGPLFWVVCIQYFIIQIVVARSWTTQFSLKNNPISDLGNTACGMYSGRFVCSPMHWLMNGSFIALGLTMIIGSILIYHEFKKESPETAIGFAGMAAAGLGGIIIGLFPENTTFHIHVIGTFLAIGVGDLAMLVLGILLVLPKNLRWFTITAGVVSIAGLALDTTKVYLGLGYGGMERVAAYPQTIWLIIFGLYMSRNHFMKLVAKRRR